MMKSFLATLDHYHLNCVGSQGTETMRALGS